MRVQGGNSGCFVHGNEVGVGFFIHDCIHYIVPYHYIHLHYIIKKININRNNECL
jgi:hypothetical protein